MKPWTVIGWVIVAYIVIALAFVLFVAVDSVTCYITGNTNPLNACEWLGLM